MTEEPADLSTDPELLAGFLDETRDQLADVGQRLVGIETARDRTEGIQAIFRAAHSIKGNSSFFGFMQAKSLAHSLENLLDALRGGRMEPDAEVITTLLSGFDLLGGMFERIRTGQQEVDDSETLQVMLASIADLVERKPLSAASDWARVRSELAAAQQVAEHLPSPERKTIAAALAQLERLIKQDARRKPFADSEGAGEDSGPLARLAEILTPPLDGMLDPALVAEVGELLLAIQQVAGDAEARTHLAELIEGYRAFCEAVGFDSLVREYLLDHLAKIRQLPGFSELVAQHDGAAAESRAPTTSVYLAADVVAHTESPIPPMALATAARPRPVPAPADVPPKPTTEASRKDASRSVLPSTSVSADSKSPVSAAVAATGERQAPTTAGGVEVGKSMRVSEAKIDTFLRYVGELLVVGDMFDHLHARAAGVAVGAGTPAHRLARDLRRASESFSELSGKLQDAIMGIRRVPIRPLLQKVPRIVRDTALAKGKECRVVIEGDSVEIDKSLTDLLDAPLTHMTRNSADHGIETPDRREAAGKPRTGTITVRASETTSSVLVMIEDDGAGLDLERIRAKAESLGLIRPGATLGEQDIVSCIFAPGLSTAEQVTDISGRGVGMDVVKRSIEEAGGAIQVVTVRGQGVKITITLPKRVTTQIMPGYLVRLGGQLYVVPLDRVRETFRVQPADVTVVAGRGHCILRHDEVLPLIALAHALDTDSTVDAPRRTAITVESKGRRLALEVDQVVGAQKIVIREIAGLPTNELLAGGALMGDGSIALILDIDVLAARGRGE
jgi:two-component system chemotaxis sensor kinase CheA